MAVERTLSIIKPDAVGKNAIGAIFSRFEAAGLKIVATKMKHLSKAEAEGFYAEHAGRGFFNDLVAFMTSGPVVVSALEGENAVLAHREILGGPNTQHTQPGTTRAGHAAHTHETAAHGSDSTASAAREIAYFFSSLEVCARTR